MNKRYKLCRVDYTQSSWVRPIDETGKDEGYTLTEFGDDGACYYAIYENIGAEDWTEWGYYEDDFDKALKEFKKLNEQYKDADGDV